MFCLQIRLRTQGTKTRNSIILITLNPNNDGLSTTDIGNFSSEDIANARNTLIKGGKLLLTDRVTFCEAKEPFFSDDSKKENSINTIKNEIQNLFVDGEFDQGNYNASVVNFNPFDTKIYVIFENNKSTFIISFNNYDNKVSFFKVLDVESDISKYKVGQFRKNILSKFTVEIK